MTDSRRGRTTSSCMPAVDKGNGVRRLALRVSEMYLLLLLLLLLLLAVLIK